MTTEIKPNFKYIFLAHFFIALILGVALLIFPLWFAETIKWPSDELYFTRLTGALMLGFGVGSLLAFRETEWERVELIVLSEITWLLLGIAVNIYGIFAVTQVFMIWVNIILLIGILCAFGWMYLKHK